MDISKIWYDCEVVALSQEAKMTLIALLTSPNANTFGIYQVRPEVMAAETGFDAKAFDKGFAELKEKGMIAYDEKTFVVAVLCWFRFTTICNPKHAIGILRRLKKAIVCDATQAFYDSAEKLIIKKYGIEIIGQAFVTTTPIDNQTQSPLATQDTATVSAVEGNEIVKLSTIDIPLKNNKHMRLSQDDLKGLVNQGTQTYPNIDCLSEINNAILYLRRPEKSKTNKGAVISTIRNFMYNADQKRQGKDPFSQPIQATPEPMQNTVGQGVQRH